MGILVYLFCVAGSTGQTERVSGGDRARFCHNLVRDKRDRRMMYMAVGPAL